MDVLLYCFECRMMSQKYICSINLMYEIFDHLQGGNVISKKERKEKEKERRS